jgi:hypothetical protein
MSRNRTKYGLAAVMVLLMGAAAPAQGLRDMAWFAPVDDSRYGGGPSASEGYFFTFSGLYWHLSPPEQTFIGKDGLTRNVVNVPALGFDTATLTYPLPITVEYSSVNTGSLESEMSNGQRYELGHVSGHHGWYFEGFRLSNFNQDLYASDASVVFEDAPVAVPKQVWDPTQTFNPPVTISNILGRLEGYYDTALSTGGPLPVTFTELTASNSVETWGVEWNYLYRTHPHHFGGIFEFFIGGRYLEFNEEFFVEGIGGILDESQWFTGADNHIVGPQFGVHWFRRQNRWTWSVQSQFFAGFNAQSINQNAVLASNLLPTAPPTPGQPVKLTSTVRTESELNLDEWSPSAELRVEVKYQLTQDIAASFGWAGMWLNGIARPSNMIDYALHSDGSIMGILDANSRQEVFLNGFTIGVELNR